MDIPGHVEAAPVEEAGYVMLRITSEAGGLLIGRHGQTLDALEYLINRTVGRQDEQGGRILVDAEGYRERRSQELREMATRLAARVHQTARAQSMNPLSPRERRIVHMALSGDSTVITRSVGEGQLRRVVIYPARDGPRPASAESRLTLKRRQFRSRSVPSPHPTGTRRVRQMSRGAVFAGAGGD